MIIKVDTQEAPAAIGPYSQAIKADGMVFISGQIPIDMSTGEMCTGSIQEMARCSLNNLTAIAKAAGTSLDKAVKTTVLLADINDFAAVNEVYAEYFPAVKPARSCFAVAALPKNARLEIELICAE